MCQAALCTLKNGEQAYVASIGAAAALGRRLLDLGLIPGTAVTCLFRSPSGDPAAYLIRGAVIALRQKDAAEVWVTSRRCSPDAEAAGGVLQEG